MSAKVIPLRGRRQATTKVEVAELVRASATAYSNPQAGLALQADPSAGLVHVLVAVSADESIELAWTVVEARRIARQLLRLADAAEGTG